MNFFKEIPTDNETTERNDFKLKYTYSGEIK
jgi:hypothetical protein